MRRIMLAVMLAAVLPACGFLPKAPVATGSLAELIDVERAAVLRDSVCSQVSSYDRTGSNNDGFDGKYSYLRKEGNDLVIFDAQGPGCIYRLWSADPLDGWVKFYFDGEAAPRLQAAHFRDLFTGAIYPFVPPLSQHVLGGWCSYLPIPFARSLKIVAGGPVNFLQITWQRFPSADGVKTFDPKYTPEERRQLERVKEAWSHPGTPPLPHPPSTRTKRVSLNIAPGRTGTLAKLAGAGLVRELRLSLSSSDVKIGRKALLLMTVDGQAAPSIYSPVGDFFLDPYGDGACASMLAGKAKDGYYAFWAMPYAAGATIRVRNESSRPLSLTATVCYQPVKALPAGMGRFFAWWHRQNPTVMDQGFSILQACGRGQWCGVSHAMQNESIGIGFLEGDEMLWVDGRDCADYHGTGTEDYFNGGWYFGATGSAPLYGCGRLEARGVVHAFRLHLTDLVPFQRMARIEIEHGPVNSWPSDYAGVTYWYAEPGTTHAFAPTPMPERLSRPEPRRNVTEAETCLDPISGGTIVDDSDLSGCLSAGRGVATAVGAIGESFTLQVDAPADGRYCLDLGFVAGPGRGIARVALDGQPLGEAIDTYAPVDRGTALTRLGLTTPLARGPHRITVTAAGSNPASRGATLLLDYLRWRDDAFYEAEELPVTAVVDGALSVKSYVNTSGFYPEAPLNNVKLRWFQPTGPAPALTLRLPVLKSGRTRIVAHLYRFAQSGIARFSVDGVQSPVIFDGYYEWISFGEVDLGEWDLVAGDHALTIQVIGKNAKASGNAFAVDWITVR